MNRAQAAAPKIVYAGGYEGRSEFPIHKHENSWELVYLVEGRISERSGEDVVDLVPGAFIVHSPGTPHGDIADSRYFLYHVQVTSDRPIGWPRLGHDLDGAPIASLLSMVVAEWYNSFPQRESFLKHAASLLDVLMQRCAVQQPNSGAALAVVTDVRGVFRREFRNPIDLKAIAADRHISRSTLYAYFHQVLGRTPQEVLDAIRLKHAVYLLRHTKLPIGEVAIGAGYCSASHLGRKLQSAYRLTARQIRESFVVGEEGPPAAGPTKSPVARRTETNGKASRGLRSRATLTDSEDRKSSQAGRPKRPERSE